MVNVQHKVYSAVKKLNYDIKDVEVKRRVQLSELDEMRLLRAMKVHESTKKRL